MLNKEKLLNELVQSIINIYSNVQNINTENEMYNEAMKSNIKENVVNILDIIGKLK